MQTKSLAYGLIGFLLGGLLVSIAATTFNKPDSMTDMAQMLQTKQGKAYDQAFVEMMIEHHEAAITMARLSADRADHQQVKDISKSIITTQQAEVNEMQQWLHDWNAKPEMQHHDM